MPGTMILFTIFKVILSLFLIAVGWMAAVALLGIGVPHYEITIVLFAIAAVVELLVLLALYFIWRPRRLPVVARTISPAPAFRTAPDESEPGPSLELSSNGELLIPRL
jgi:hypothetical protein